MRRAGFTVRFFGQTHPPFQEAGYPRWRCSESPKSVESEQRVDGQLMAWQPQPDSDS